MRRKKRDVKAMLDKSGANVTWRGETGIQPLLQPSASVQTQEIPTVCFQRIAVSHHAEKL